MFKTALLLGVLAFLVLQGFAQNDTFNARPKDRRLKIINGLRPVYPEAAKRDHIYGAVLVRVTFQADGTIGEVRCINNDNEETQRLEKYGVIQAVIDGAKKIEFQPEIKDGTAATVVKTIEYTFSVY